MPTKIVLRLILLCLILGGSTLDAYTSVDYRSTTTIPGGTTTPVPATTTTTRTTTTYPPECTEPCGSAMLALKRLRGLQSAAVKPADPAADGCKTAGSTIADRNFEGFAKPCKPLFPLSYLACRGHCTTSTRIDAQTGLFTQQLCEEICTPEPTTVDTLDVEYVCDCENGYCALMPFTIRHADTCACFLSQK